MFAVLAVTAGLLVPGAGEAQEACGEGRGDASLESNLKAWGDWQDCSPGEGTGGHEADTAQDEPFTVESITDYFLNVVCGPGRVIGNVRYTQVDPATGERTHLFDAFECVDIPEPGDDGDGPPAAPDPLDIRDAVAKMLPLPELAVDPEPDGLTGLDTYLWYDDDGSSQLEPIDHDGDPNTPPRPGLSVTATAGPFTITAQAWIEEFTWDMGDGSTYSSPSPGTHEQPAATHVYETKGTYDVLVATVWRGSYTWSVGGLTGTGDLGTVTRSDSHPYRVLEARAVLTE